MTMYTYHPSPVGDLLLVGDDHTLHGLYFDKHRRGPQPGDGWRRDDDAFVKVRDQLERYFSGSGDGFDVALRPAGTPFQHEVWNELQALDYGDTTTYGAIARRINRPSAARAVGAAVGRNPISIIVPCHRVMGSSGGITGYAGGVARKHYLLELESQLR